MVVSSAEATEIIEQKTAAKELAKSLSRSVISNIHVDETYTELTVDEDEQVAHRIYSCQSAKEGNQESDEICQVKT